MRKGPSITWKSRWSGTIVLTLLRASAIGLVRENRVLQKRIESIATIPNMQVSIPK